LRDLRETQQRGRTEGLLERQCERELPRILPIAGSAWRHACNRFIPADLSAC
jgi:hypothetical protein